MVYLLQEGTGDSSENSSDDLSLPHALDVDAVSATSSPASVVAEEPPSPPALPATRVVNLRRRRIEVETEAEKRARMDL